MTDETHVPVVYTLTDMTGQRKNRDRGVMYLGAEVNVYHRNMMMLGSPFIALAVAFTAPWMGYYSALVGGIAAITWYHLAVRRKREGLGTTSWTAIQDKRKSLAGQHVQSGIPLTPDMYEAFQVYPSSVTVNSETLPGEALPDAGWGTSTPRRRSAPAAAQPDAWADDAPMTTHDDTETW